MQQVSVSVLAACNAAQSSRYSHDARVGGVCDRSGRCNLAPGHDAFLIGSRLLRLDQGHELMARNLDGIGLSY